MIYLLSSYLFLGIFVTFSKSYVTCVDLNIDDCIMGFSSFHFFPGKTCMEIYVCPSKFLRCIQIFCPACLIPSEINSPHAHDPAYPTHQPTGGVIILMWKSNPWVDWVGWWGTPQPTGAKIFLWNDYSSCQTKPEGSGGSPPPTQSMSMRWVKTLRW
jgi:hypothetical protein